MWLMDSITSHEWSKRIRSVTLLAMTAHRRALVIGGGIAGPTLALFLARAGIQPVVFEAYPRKDDVGGGFQIAPNGLRVLAELGLADALLEAGRPSGDMAFRNHLGRDIGLVRTGGAGPAVNISRSIVHRVLRDEADRRGIVVRYERRLTDIAVAGREVIASFDDGSTEAGDFLVGADGVRSRVRAWMLPEAAAARDTGMVSIGGFCARGMTPPPDPRDGGRLTFMVGPRHQFGYSMMDEAQWGWWCHAHGESEAERSALLTMPSEDLRAHMLARYRGWSEPVGTLIGATEAWLRTPIHDVPTLPTWHRGPVLLVGDAAHAMSPAGGQGASLALEDAMVLARLVADPSRSIEEAMVRFESLRRSRAESMVAQAYANDRRSLKELGPVGMWTRDRVMMPLFASFIERALNKVYTAPLEA
jgi:2-polyprenyl-6-methoxyphenol hydroxylase-like FAD-dependent oxidoreductase